MMAIFNTKCIDIEIEKDLYIDKHLFLHKVYKIMGLFTNISGRRVNIESRSEWNGL